MRAMETFAEAVEGTVRIATETGEQADRLARNLTPVLRSCDKLTFDELLEAIPYAALHLLDRYGRVTQVLEFLIARGCLPLRLKGVNALEVGAGPAPALFAARDFYASLIDWPKRGDVAIGALQGFDTLDRGSAWDPLLYRLSEHLMTDGGNTLLPGALTFARSIHDFANFCVWRRHHEGRARFAEGILDEFQASEDVISPEMANNLAYQSDPNCPSAYDIIFLCNFLTNPEMPARFDTELRELTRSLTPGGALIAMGGTGGYYPALFETFEAIATEGGLADISPSEPFAANEDAAAHALVARHVRGNVRYILDRCSDDATRYAAAQTLPADVLSDEVPFELPRFRVAAFVRRAGPRKRLRGRKKRCG